MLHNFEIIKPALGFAGAALSWLGTMLAQAQLPAEMSKWVETGGTVLLVGFLSYAVVVPWIRQAPGSWGPTSVVANIVLMFLVTPEISDTILV